MNAPALDTAFVSLPTLAGSDTETPQFVGSGSPASTPAAAAPAATAPAAAASGSPWYVAIAQYGALGLVGVVLVALGAYTLVKD